MSVEVSKSLLELEFLEWASPQQLSELLWSNVNLLIMKPYPLSCSQNISFSRKVKLTWFPTPISANESVMNSSFELQGGIWQDFKPLSSRLPFRLHARLANRGHGDIQTFNVELIDVNMFVLEQLDIRTTSWYIGFSIWNRVCLHEHKIVVADSPVLVVMISIAGKFCENVSISLRINWAFELAIRLRKGRSSRDCWPQSGE